MLGEWHKLICQQIFILEQSYLLKMVNVSLLTDIAAVLRRDSLEMTTAAGSGHPTSCLSCADIMSVLFFNEMKYDTAQALHTENDEFILSKGHAAAIYYAALSRAGCLKTSLQTYRQLSSPLEGHPTPNASPWIKITSGSLGQGLSVGIGMALAAKLLKRNYRTYVLLGDSELAEGSIYEAAQLAVEYDLGNLCAIVDINRLGQRGETIVGHNLQRYKQRFSGFGWNVISVDGHNIKQIMQALVSARRSKKPSVILAKTFKGKGVSFLSNKEGWHGKALNTEELARALAELPNPTFPGVTIKKPSGKGNITGQKISVPAPSEYSEKEEHATREAYGNALAKLAESNKHVLAVDAEVSNSTFADRVKKQSPAQFIEAYIAEQNMIGMAQGLSCKGFNVFASSFAAFLSRAHDQLRMAALSGASFSVCGSHAGVSIGEDGGSQMGLEDIGMFRSLFGSSVLYPSDAISAEKLTYLAAKNDGITYLRTTRPKTPHVYTNDDSFTLGGFGILRSSTKDKVVLAGAGITLHEALKAQEILQQKGILTAVVDIYCVKPFDYTAFLAFVNKHGGKLVIAEDHYAQGGIGEMLAEGLVNTDIELLHLAVRDLPHSGKGEELLSKYEIDADALVRSALSLNA